MTHLLIVALLTKEFWRVRGSGSDVIVNKIVLRGEQMSLLIKNNAGSGVGYRL